MFVTLLNPYKDFFNIKFKIYCKFKYKKAVYIDFDTVIFIKKMLNIFVCNSSTKLWNKLNNKAVIQQLITKEHLQFYYFWHSDY